MRLGAPPPDGAIVAPKYNRTTYRTAYEQEDTTRRALNIAAYDTMVDRDHYVNHALEDQCEPSQQLHDLIVIDTPSTFAREDLLPLTT